MLAEGACCQNYIHWVPNSEQVQYTLLNKLEKNAKVAFGFCQIRVTDEDHTTENVVLLGGTYDGDEPCLATAADFFCKNHTLKQDA